MEKVKSKKYLKPDRRQVCVKFGERELSINVDEIKLFAALSFNFGPHW